jgi:hypothetical protein
MTRLTWLLLKHPLFEQSTSRADGFRGKIDAADEVRQRLKI